MNNGFSYLISAELTDVGRRRKNNEDSVLRLAGQGVFCVADGMGGVQGGEVASQATIDALRQTFTDSPDAPYAVTAAASACLVARALNSASQWIKARSDERGLTGAGSTAVIIAFDQITPSKAIILHAGDSRAYRFRIDKLVQLSADHSVAAAAGLPDDKDLPAMFRGVITRAVGLENTVRLEETPTDVQADDLFLLCSDGLNKMVSDKHLHKLLHKHLREDLQALAKILIDEALKAGGEDNVSVVLVRVAKTLPQSPTLEIPPETLALEASDSEPETRILSSEPCPDEAPTRETGQTADPADGESAEKGSDRKDSPKPPPPVGSSVERTSDTGGQQTPVTPPSGEGATPVYAPRPKPSSLTLILLVVLLLAVVALGLFALHSWAQKSRGERSVAPTVAQPLPLETPNR